VALMLPPWLDGLGNVHGVTRVLMSLTLIPQALPLSLPAGVCIGVLSAMRGRRPTGRAFSAVLIIGIASVVAAAMIIEWLVPQANQAFRNLVIAQLHPGQSYHLEPGLNEIGLSGLARRTDPVGVRHFHIVSALCFATIPLSLFALGLTRYVKHFAIAVIVAFLASIAYPISMIVLSSLEPREWLSPIIEAWIPNLLFLAAAWVMLNSLVASAFRRKLPRVSE
jgi:lipopolysaccharide export LptBFGC system permease protein LptF